MNSLIPTVLFVSLTVAGVYCVDEDVPSKYIDYSDCSWKYERGGNVVRCDAGYVATGACSNKGQTRCNNMAHGIECCKLRSGDTKGDCINLYGQNGDQVDCPFGSQVFTSCSSLDIATCSTSQFARTITIDCCVSDLVVTENCNWRYVDTQGSHLTCEKYSGGEQVLAGRCGSQTIASCPGGNVHGIRCCDLA